MRARCTPLFPTVGRGGDARAMNSGSSPSLPSVRPQCASISRCLHWPLSSSSSPLPKLSSSAQKLSSRTRLPPPKRASKRTPEPRPAVNGRTDGRTEEWTAGAEEDCEDVRRGGEGAGACRLGCCCCCCDSNRRTRDSTAQTWSLEKKTGGGGKSGMSNSSRSAREAVRILKIASVWCKCITFSQPALCRR